MECSYLWPQDQDECAMGGQGQGGKIMSQKIITKKWRRSNLMWIFLTQPRGSDFEACSSLSGEMCVSWMHCFRAPPASLLRFDSIMLVMITYWMNVTFKTFKSPGLLEFRLPTSLTNRLKNASKATPLPNTPWRTASNSNTSIRYLNCKILSWTIFQMSEQITQTPGD